MIKKVLFTSMTLFGFAFSQMPVKCFAEETINFEQAKQNAFSLIDKGDYSSSEVAVNQLITDNPGRADLPETLYWLGVRYEWSGRPEEAKHIYQQIVNSYPSNIWANKAELGIARNNAISLVLMQNYDGAKEAIDQLITDFSGHPDLPEALYWIVYRYEWQNEYNEAKSICQQIVENYPNSPYVNKAKMGVLRADAMYFIVTQNHNLAEEAIDKLTTDFAGNPDLPEALFLIAERYEWINRFMEARAIYQRIVQNYTNTPNESKAKLSDSIAEVRSLIIAQDYSGAEEAFDKVIADFSEHSDLPRLTILVGEQFYKEGLAMESKGFSEQAKNYYERAIKIWCGLISRNPDSVLIPEACCWIGDYYNKIDRYEESIQYFQRVVDNHPYYKHAWHAQFAIGSLYQRMKVVGIIPESEANLKTKAAYQNVVSKWPGCNSAGNALIWLNEHN